MMKYLFLAAAVMALTLTACDGKKHPMDKPPPSASVERDSAPNFDELDKPSTDGASSGQGATSGGDVKKEEPAK
jgi:predicted small lipoprotein YifL